MAHFREGIRKAIVAAITGLPTTGANVDLWRVSALERTELPHLNVMPAEDPEAISDSIDGELDTTIETRDLPVTIEIRALQESATGHSELADKVDDICFEVESALASNPTLGGLVVDLRLFSSGFSIDDEGERPVGVAKLNWLVRYEVDRVNPAA